MPDYTAIAAVGETLISLLRDNMKDLIAPEKIVLISPGEIEASDSVRLSLFLYRIIENVHLKNQEMIELESNRLKYPPLTLDLFYMLTSHPSDNPNKTERTKEEHSLLGRAMQIFHDNAILTGSSLRGSLAEKGVEIHITLSPLSLEEMTQIWNTFQDKPLRPSACYLVTPVMIDSTRKKGVKRVVERKLEKYQRGM